jgi:hypothetical protein
LEFRRLEPDNNDRMTISVTCHGSDGPFGIEYAYNQPKSLVIRYSSNSDEALWFKQFAIPTGSGPRSMTISLP